MLSEVDTQPHIKMAIALYCTHPFL